MIQERGGMIHFERLGAGVVKMTVHGKSLLHHGRSAGVEILLDAEEMFELELDVRKAQRLP